MSKLKPITLGLVHMFVGSIEANAFLSPAKSPAISTMLIQVHRSVGESAPEAKEMTVETVDRVLNEIRGYLFADGGDIEVVKVESGSVFVRFQGNCSSCASQETTMTMGVERSLRAAFGDSLREVVPLPPTDAMPTGVTTASVNSLLDLLRPAIKGYGGKVEARSVEGGLCVVEYEGPEPIWIGVRSAIRDKFPDVLEVQRA
jgi:NFU1 iron-sulfur cluster scaffold homolog, mitochondrial